MTSVPFGPSDQSLNLCQSSRLPCHLVRGHRLKTVFDQLHHAGGFEGGVLPGHATLYLCPHKFYGVQIHMIGRESQTVMPMLPQDIV